MSFQTIQDHIWSSCSLVRLVGLVVFFSRKCLLQLVHLMLVFLVITSFQSLRAGQRRREVIQVKQDRKGEEGELFVSSECVKNKKNMHMQECSLATGFI